MPNRARDWMSQALRDLEQAQDSLDNYYIPPRHPNSHPEGAAFEHYGPLQSGEAIGYAGEIIDFVRARMA